MKKKFYEEIRDKLKLIKDELPCCGFDMSDENLCELNLEETYTDTFAFTEDEKLKVTTYHRVELDSHDMVHIKEIINSVNEENEGELMLDDMFGKSIVFEQTFDFEYAPTTLDLLHIIAEQLSVINEFMTKLYEFYTNHFNDADSQLSDSDIDSMLDDEPDDNQDCDISFNLDVFNYKGGKE